MGVGVAIVELFELLPHPTRIVQLASKLASKINNGSLAVTTHQTRLLPQSNATNSLMTSLSYTVNQ